MKSYLPLFFFFTVTLFAQAKLRITVQDSLSHEPLVGANIFVKNTSKGASTDLNGVSLLKLKEGENVLKVSYVGYKTKEVKIEVTAIDSIKNVVVFLVPTNIEEQQITVSTSRVNSYINSSPQRVEILGTEELQEKTVENPSNISELLSELSAVQVVQTSSLSGTTNFRLLGLSGQYTQILKDGFPLFGGLSQDFGLIQTPPLDLAQIEIIKGASATFYGNGAVAGIINLISKMPVERPKSEILLNGTNYGGFDAGAFYSSKKNRTAFTALLMADVKPPKDVNGDGFTEISKLRKFNFEPKFFFQMNETSRLDLGVSFLRDEHTGGDITAINTSPSSLHPFILQSLSSRLTATVDFQKAFGKESSMNVKSGISLFDLSIESPDILFKGKQTSSFSEISYYHNSDFNNFTIGISFLTDDFIRDQNSSLNLNSPFQTQFGLFAVDNFKLSRELNLQGGLRFESSNNFKSYLLPNASLIFKPADDFFIRLGYGTGYRIPAPISFLSEFERNDAGLKIIAPTCAELSSSLSLDCNYDFMIGEELFVKFNQTFFSIDVKNPYQETTDAVYDQSILFSQPNSLKSYGTETNLRIGIDDANLFIGLTYQKTERKYFNDTSLPLTPDFKVVTIFQIENEKLWELDLGNIYTGSQYLSSGKKENSYTTFEALLKMKVGLFDVVFNCENIFNFRQSDREPLVIPPFQNPRFEEIWGPVEGRTINIALIYDL